MITAFVRVNVCTRFSKLRTPLDTSQLRCILGNPVISPFQRENFDVEQNWLKECAKRETVPLSSVLRFLVSSKIGREGDELGRRQGKRLPTAVL